MIISSKFRIHNNNPLYFLHQLCDISGIIYNHCIALHKRYYSLYNKHLNKFVLQKHLTKLKKLDKFSHFKLLGSQAIQQITERIDNAYKKFFDYKKGKTSIKSGTPTFKKIKYYSSFTLKGKVGYKLKSIKENKSIIRIGKKEYRFKNIEISMKIKSKQLL